MQSQPHYKKYCYSFLLISNLLDSLYKACIYIKINLHHTYHLVHIAEDNKQKTTFYTCYRFFKLFIISFDLTNALIIFQYFMNNIFSDLLGVCMVIYLDNILIYSDNMANHTKQVKEVLCYLQKARIYVNAKKYKFHSELVEYLGYILSSSRLTIANNKIKII